MNARELWVRLTYPLRQRRIARELREEMDLHVSLRAARMLDRGEAPSSDEAMTEARRRFGNASRTAYAARDAWGWHWLDGLGQDLRYVLRQLGHSPGFALVTVMTIAVGVAINAAAFTFYNAIVLKPLPVRDPGSVVRIVQDRNSPRFEEMPFAAYDALRHARSLEGLVLTTGPQAVGAVMPGRSPDEAKAIAVRFASPDFAHQLGLRAALGRWLDGTDDAVAVLDHRFWVRELQADPSIVGRSITIRGRSFTVIGIADESFAGTGMPAMSPDVWLPVAALPAVLGQDWRYDGRAHWQLLGRLAPGATVGRLRGELEGLRAGVRDSAGKPLPISAKRATFFQSDAGEFEIFQQVSAALMVALALILGIGLVNLINLFAARNATRAREIAVRLALGASRLRIARQLASESLLLALAAGALGLMASRYLTTWFRDWLSVTMSSISGGLVNMFFDLTIDWRVVAYTIVLSAAIGLGIGLWPALRSSRVDANTVLREGGTSTAGGTAWTKRHVLLGIQVASCTVLLAAAGFLLGGLRLASRIDPRFDTPHMLAVFVNDVAAAPEQRAASRAEIQRRLSALPMVRAVAWSKRIPLDGSETRTATSPSGSVTVSLNHISASYFEAMGVSIAKGRMFSDAEVATNSAVMLVSDAFARRRWPGEDPVGKTIPLHNIASGPDTNAVYTVIGVVPDIRSDYLSRENGPTAYYPYDYRGDFGAFIVRTRGVPASAVSAVRLAINSVSPSLSAEAHVMTMEGGPMALQRLMAEAPAVTALALATAGLSLAAIGIYAVIAGIVTRRTREIGVRIALGARPAQVIALVMRKTMRPVAIGALFGGMGAVGVSLLLRAMIALPDAPDLTFGAGALNPLVFLGVVAALVLVVAAACYVPARRAAGLEPTVALRSD
jgi:predicted permease